MAWRRCRLSAHRRNLLRNGLGCSGCSACLGFCCCCYCCCCCGATPLAGSRPRCRNAWCRQAMRNCWMNCAPRKHAKRRSGLISRAKCCAWGIAAPPARRLSPRHHHHHHRAKLSNLRRPRRRARKMRNARGAKGRAAVGCRSSLDGMIAMILT